MNAAQLTGLAIQLATGVKTGVVLVSGIEEAAKSLISLFHNVPSQADVDALVNHDLVDAARREVLEAAQAKG